MARFTGERLLPVRFSREGLLSGLKPENHRTSWGKKSSEGSARSPYKQKSQFHMGIYRWSIKIEHFSTVFGVFDPLRLTSRLCRRPPAPPLSTCTRRPFLRKNAVSPRKFAGFRNPGSAHPLELVFLFIFFFLSICHGQWAALRSARARPDLQRFASTGRAFRGLAFKAWN